MVISLHQHKGYYGDSCENKYIPKKVIHTSMHKNIDKHALIYMYISHIYILFFFPSAIIFKIKISEYKLRVYFDN